MILTCLHQVQPICGVRVRVCEHARRVFATFVCVLCLYMMLACVCSEIKIIDGVCDLFFKTLSKASCSTSGIPS